MNDLGIFAAPHSVDGYALVSGKKRIAIFHLTEGRKENVPGCFLVDDSNQSGQINRGAVSRRKTPN